MRRRRIRIVCGLGAVIALGLGGAYALADDTVSTAPVGFAYSQPTFTITGGQVARFSNTQAIAHSVSADDTKTLGGKPLFDSAIFASGTGAVKGTQYLAPGDYTFHCAVHGPIMSATLHVVGGTPVARPTLTVAITSTKLGKVRKTGKLSTTVSDAGSDAAGVALTATVGRKRLSTKRGLRVAAGASAPVALKLSKAGKKALKGKDQAKVKLNGTVDFGKPAKATGTLR